MKVIKMDVDSCILAGSDTGNNVLTNSSDVTYNDYIDEGDIDI